MAASRFKLVNGVPDSEQIEEWAEEYFQSLLRMMNLFYARTDLPSVLESLEAIKFSQMAAQELVGETAEVIEIAVNIIDEIAAREIEYIKAYMV
jgi:hypothetical protein